MKLKGFINSIPIDRSYDILLSDTARSTHAFTDIRDVIVMFGDKEVKTFKYFEGTTPWMKIELE